MQESYTLVAFFSSLRRDSRYSSIVLIYVSVLFTVAYGISFISMNNFEGSNVGVDRTSPWAVCKVVPISWLF